MPATGPTPSPPLLPISNPATAEQPLTPPAPRRRRLRRPSRRHRLPAWRTPPRTASSTSSASAPSSIESLDDVARTIVLENGKTLAEAKAEIQRGLENIEVACGIPTLMQGYNLEDVAAGIDEIMIRQPLGVVACITPFNFPAMIPLWFLPYALACGNTLIVKPSERVPLTVQKLFALIERAGFPKGVCNLVNGGKAAVDALLDHPGVRAISFVGSTPVAKYVYTRGSANGKRVQCQGGAKNHVVVLPDADLPMTTKIVSDSAFGCAGQRCLAVSVAVTVGEARSSFRDAIVDMAASIRVGNGLDPQSQMGPVITRESKQRIEACIESGTRAGATAVLDGRNHALAGGAGNFLAPTVLDGGEGELSQTEIFGPVLTLVHAETVEHAIEIINSNPYGNAASIFTTSGVAARKFRYEANAGNIGVNIGVAAPMAYFPFSGWKDSFLGVLHGQGRDAVEFYTDKKVVIERWPSEWSRKF
ncbi:MAG: CoA-acylating methylmalonate-semialdehyde dehydrogenase [Bryobacteraceae bacterium]